MSAWSKRKEQLRSEGCDAFWAGVGRDQAPAIGGYHWQRGWDEAKAAFQPRPERPDDTWNALIDYAIEADEATTLLRLWREGSFDEIRSEWPDFPEAAFPKEARR